MGAGALVLPGSLLSKAQEGRRGCSCLEPKTGQKQQLEPKCWEGGKGKGTSASKLAPWGATTGWGGAQPGAGSHVGPGASIEHQGRAASYLHVLLPRGPAPPGRPEPRSVSQPGPAGERREQNEASSPPSPQRPRALPAKHLSLCTRLAWTLPASLPGQGPASSSATRAPDPPGPCGPTPVCAHTPLTAPQHGCHGGRESRAPGDSWSTALNSGRLQRVRRRRSPRTETPAAPLPGTVQALDAAVTPVVSGGQLQGCMLRLGGSG